MNFNNIVIHKEKLLLALLIISFSFLSCLKKQDKNENQVCTKQESVFYDADDLSGLYDMCDTDSINHMYINHKGDKIYLSHSDDTLRISYSNYYNIAIRYVYKEKQLFPCNGILLYKNKEWHNVNYVIHNNWLLLPVYDIKVSCDIALMVFNLDQVAEEEPRYSFSTQASFFLVNANNGIIMSTSTPGVGTDINFYYSILTEKTLDSYLTKSIRTEDNKRWRAVFSTEEGTVSYLKKEFLKNCN